MRNRSQSERAEIANARGPRASFADYKPDAHTWITLATGEYYPDVLVDACQLFSPVLVRFGQLLERSESSSALFLAVNAEGDPWMRRQLLRVFKRYVSPALPVEMTKHRTKAQQICERYSEEFRAVQQVHAAYRSRPADDEALCALLWEYRTRGQKGYDLTGRLFALLRGHLQGVEVAGPEGAGPDIRLGDVFDGYPSPQGPVDFVLRCEDRILAVGLVRYDPDRGGAQEDDRTGAYRACADEILRFARRQGMSTKVVFVNDGPGLLLGSMWDDYAALERRGRGRVRVVTLRMVPERITMQWLQS